MKEQYIKLLKDYGFEYIDEVEHRTIQVGNGDILLYALHVENGIVNPPLNVNLRIFTDNVNEIGSGDNFFEFKLKLFKLIKAPVRFFYHHDILYIDQANNSRLVRFDNLHKYFDFHEEPEISGEYIVFHTKCRFDDNLNYQGLIDTLSEAYEKIKMKCRVILMGERIMPPSYEQRKFNIKTIYPALIKLKLRDINEIIDLTIENIYNNQDIDQFKRDMKIIHHAKLNVCVGHGGQFVNSILFGRKTIAYLGGLDLSHLNGDVLTKCGVTIHRELGLFIKDLLRLSDDPQNSLDDVPQNSLDDVLCASKTGNTDYHALISD